MSFSKHLGYVCLSAAFAAISAAGPLVPVLSPDGTDLDDDNPYLGKQIFALPGSTWAWGFNDNPSGQPGVPRIGDHDFRDAFGFVGFGEDNAGKVDGTIYFLDGSTADRDVVFAGLTGAMVGAEDPTPKVFQANTYEELILIGMDLTAGYTWFSGPQDRNPTGGYQFWIAQVPNADSAPVPEPSSCALAGLGAVVVAVKLALRKG